MKTRLTQAAMRLHRRAQQGVVLVMALVFLLILTILGMAAMNTTVLEEKMAYNSKDRNLAFQSAEAALKVGETWISTRLGAPTDFPSTSQGLYQPSTSSTPVWESVAWTGSSNLVVYPSTPEATVSGSLVKINSQPKYVVEYLGPVRDSQGSLTLNTQNSSVKHYYRISARGTGGTDLSVVMVQSTFARYE